MLQIIQNCRSQLDFFNFNSDDGRQARDAAPIPFGHYMVPLACEYCGAKTTDDCGSSCERPKLFFRKQRPPFAPKEGWDAVTEYRMPEETTESIEQSVEAPPKKNNWMKGLLEGVMSS